ncbi:MAG: hypothetical protein R8G66_32130 [Cytophagales bacterium]|nr:hypothetical protein [Cytophagales bacterium]
MATELWEYLQKVRALKSRLYPGHFDQAEVLRLIADLDMIFATDAMSDTKSYYEEVFHPALYRIVSGQSSSGLQELREGRALVTKLMLLILDEIEGLEAS